MPTKHRNPICYVVDDKGKSLPVYAREDEMSEPIYKTNNVNSALALILCWSMAVGFLVFAAVRAAIITEVWK